MAIVVSVGFDIIGGVDVGTGNGVSLPQLTKPDRSNNDRNNMLALLENFFFPHLILLYG
jgi:hypothetical protein